MIDPTTLPGLSGLLGAAATFQARGPAPVHLWHPPFCGDIDLRIAADGTWFYAGTPIRRLELVRLFASILRRDGDRYVLVTPAECVGIEVEDLPLRAVAMESRSDALVFETDCGDRIQAGEDHALRFDAGASDGVKPAVHVRGQLWARLTRSLAYDLLSRLEADPEGEDRLGIRSGGCFFAVETLGTEP